MQEWPQFGCVNLDMAWVEPSVSLAVSCVEWATDEVLFFTSLEDLRCRRVFRLDLSMAEPETTLVYEEQHPE